MKPTVRHGGTDSVWPHTTCRTISGSQQIMNTYHTILSKIKEAWEGCFKSDKSKYKPSKLVSTRTNTLIAAFLTIFQIRQVKVRTAKATKRSHKHSHYSLPLLYFKSGKSKYKPPKLVSARTNTLITAFPLYLFFGKNVNRKVTWVQRTILMTRSSIRCSWRTSSWSSSKADSSLIKPRKKESISAEHSPVC